MRVFTVRLDLGVKNINVFIVKLDLGLQPHWSKLNLSNHMCFYRQIGLGCQNHVCFYSKTGLGPPCARIGPLKSCMFLLSDLPTSKIGRRLHRVIDSNIELHKVLYSCVCSTWPKCHKTAGPLFCCST